MKTKEKSLRILSLDVENILRVVAVHIQPDGRVVELTGKNRAGKSSAIDGLWMALGGEKMIPADPIHDGAEAGKVIVKIGDADGIKLTVTRRLRRKEEGGFSPSLTVENEDGGKFQNPQQILNSLVGQLSCDPLEFISMKPEKQFDLLKQFVPGIDFDAIALATHDDFARRTETNRDAKAKRTRAEGIPIDESAPTETIDESALVAELAGASEKNAAVERWRAAQSDRTNRIASLENSAAHKRLQAEQLRRQADQLAEAARLDDSATADLAAEIINAGEEPPTISTAELTAKIASARIVNTKFEANERAKTEKARLTAEAVALESQSAALTKAMQDRDAAKEKAIAEAQMPIEGLSFGDGVVMFEGHPIGQASQAQKLSVAISIAVALQPRLRFVTTKNAALLDDDSWKALVDLAEKQDLLIIAETVGSKRPTAVVIEDGHVRGAVQQAAE